VGGKDEKDGKAKAEVFVHQPVDEGYGQHVKLHGTEVGHRPEKGSEGGISVLLQPENHVQTRHTRAPPSGGLQFIFAAATAMSCQRDRPGWDPGLQISFPETDWCRGGSSTLSAGAA